MVGFFLFCRWKRGFGFISDLFASGFMRFLVLFVCFSFVLSLAEKLVEVLLDRFWGRKGVTVVVLVFYSFIFFLNIIYFLKVNDFFKGLLVLFAIDDVGNYGFIRV